MRGLGIKIAFLCLFSVIGLLSLFLSSACARFAKKKIPSFHYEIPIPVTYKEIKDRKLEWSDFIGTPDYSKDWACYTKVFFWADTDSSYNYALPGETYDDYVEPNLKMHYYITSESWVKAGKATDALLNHSQTYWNIAIMCGMEYEKAVQLLKPIPRYDWRIKLDSMFQCMKKKFDQTAMKYDEETNYGLNLKQQKYWDSKILFNIEKLKNQ